MPAPSSTPQDLDEALLALGDDAMLIDELDGFLTGIVVCPELILPSAWLHHIWGHGSAEEIAPFEDKDAANRFLSLVMGHFNGIAEALNEGPGCFEPVVSEDTNSGEVLWELWISGFARAVRLRPKAFGSLLQADAQTAAAYARLLYLETIADGEYKGDESEISAAIEGAHTEIGGLIDTLHAWRLKNETHGAGLGLGPNPFTATSGHVGRNDPCPCGSGKKYKKCCGLN